MSYVCNSRDHSLPDGRMEHNQRGKELVQLGVAGVKMLPGENNTRVMKKIKP